MGKKQGCQIAAIKPHNPGGKDQTASHSAIRFLTPPYIDCHAGVFCKQGSARP
jgi:hypothetical protein